MFNRAHAQPRSVSNLWTPLLILGSLGLLACEHRTDGEPTVVRQGAVSAVIAISGRVTGASGGVVAGVTVTLAGSRQGVQTTDAGGNYAFTGLAPGSYSLLPSRAGCSFTPQVVNLNNLTADAHQDFAGAGSACAGAAPPDGGAGDAAGGGPPAAPGIGAFALLASGSISLGDRDHVTTGDVGTSLATGNPFTLTVGHDDVIPGDLFGAATQLFDRANVGNVSANQLTAPFATFRSRSAFTPPPAVPSAGPFAAGGQTVSVGSGATTTLAAGSYGSVTVQGTLRLSGGVYQISSLTLGPGATLIAAAASVVRVAGALSAADRVTLNVGPNLTAAALRLVVGAQGPNAASVGNDARVTALLLVPRGTVTARDRLVLSGAIAAGAIAIGNDAGISGVGGFGCSADAACNDGNVCTQDACGDGFCTSSATANGSACNDGNACTQNDTCQGGACVGANPLPCAASDQCHLAGTCDPATGQCSNPAAPDETACNDGNLCTVGDSCLAGVCVEGGPVFCFPRDCRVNEACNPASGQCTDTVVPDGTPCSIGVCTGGVCGASPLTIRYHQVGACNGFVTGDRTTAVGPNAAYVIFGIESIDNSGGSAAFAFDPRNLFVAQTPPDFFDPSLLLYSDVLAPNAAVATTVNASQRLTFSPSGLGALVVSTSTSSGADEANQTAYFLGYQAQATDPAVTLVKTDAARQSWPITPNCRDIQLQ